jgi:hypothetical protein
MDDVEFFYFFIFQILIIIHMEFILIVPHVMI